MEAGRADGLPVPALLFQDRPAPEPGTAAGPFKPGIFDQVVPFRHIPVLQLEAVEPCLTAGVAQTAPYADLCPIFRNGKGDGDPLPPVVDGGVRSPPHRFRAGQALALPGAVQEIDPYRGPQGFLVSLGHHILCLHIGGKGVSPFPEPGYLLGHGRLPVRTAPPPHQDRGRPLVADACLADHPILVSPAIVKGGPAVFHLCVSSVEAGVGQVVVHGLP